MHFICTFSALLLHFFCTFVAPIACPRALVAFCEGFYTFAEQTPCTCFALFLHFSEKCTALFLHFCKNVHCICGGLCARNACHALRFLGCVPLPWRQGPCAPPGQSPPLWVMWPPAGELGEERRVGYGGERGRGRRPGGTRDTWRAWPLGSCILVTMASSVHSHMKLFV